MKKFYAFAFAACAALSMNATIYVVGEGDGLGWDLPGKAYEGTNNVYTFTINNLSKFKASINNSTEWDGEGNYNAGCYTTGSNSFSADQVYPNGQTLPIEINASDQLVPYIGNYTITIDLNAMTMTAQASTEAPEPTDSGYLYVVGAGDGLTWDLPGKAYEAVSPGIYTFTVTNLGKFKASTANTTNWDVYNASAYATGNESFGESVYPNGQTLPIQIWGEDQELPYAGDYTITINLNAMTMTAKTTTPLPTSAPACYIRGNMNNWLNDGLDSKWQFKSVEFIDANHVTYEFICSEEAGTVINAGVEFKIADGTWSNINYTSGSMITPDPYEAVPLVFNDMTNMSIDSDFEGKITFIIDGAKNGLAYFDNEYNGVKGVEVDNNLPVEYFNLQGVRVENPENGLFIARQGNKVTKVIK